MKSNAPWSVKGIERDARETAKEAAKREGMTVGEWLNQMIYAAGDPQASHGEVEGLKLRDIVTAIDHLNKRLADGAADNRDSVADLTRKLGGAVERLQRLERGAPDQAPSSDVETRIARLEQDRGDRERVEALKALEKAVAQVAVQFSNAQKTTLERLDSTEQQIKTLALSAETGDGGEDNSAVSFLKDALDGLQTRMTRTERLATEASRSTSGGGDPEFVETTGKRLRVLGDEIKRGGDQIRALEATIAKLAKQIEAAERRSAEGVQKTAETLAELREKFAGGQFDSANREDIAAVVADQTRDTVKRVDRLHESFDKMLSQLEQTGIGGAAAPTVKTTESELKQAPSEPTTPDQADAEAVDSPDAPVLEAPAAETDQPVAETEEASTEQTEDDDFFSFADDIDASIDDKPASDAEEDFSFELDGESDAAPDEEGAALLSEVQDVFRGVEKETPSDDGDSDLDELLAGLDDLADETPAEPEEETPAPPVAEAAETADAPADDGPPPFAEQPSEEEPVRERPTRRKLTPKQKAILAARARRKRLAAAAEDKVDPATRAAAKKALGTTEPGDAGDIAAPSDLIDDVVEKDTKDDGGSRLAALRSKVPFLGGAVKKTDDDEDLDETIETGGDKAALETLKSTASARPVTLALGVGIFLAVGLLFLMIKDFIFSPRDDAPAPTAAVSPPSGSVSDTAATAAPTLEAPAAPAIDPRTLYRDAMTGLNAAETEAESAVAIEKLEQAALLGHPPAQLQLGELYKTGQGVDQDLAQARTWFRRAANGGNVLAMHRIGVMTARGEGGAANTPEAVGWFEQAANRGLVDSQYNLGAIYHPNGAGPEAGSVQDAGKAYYWYSLAAKNGDQQAEPLAAGISADMNSDQKAGIDEAVASWEALPSDAEANTLAVSG